MDKEELKKCIQLLRERRESLPALRDYRPQRKGSSSTPTKEVDLATSFGNLFARSEADEAAPATGVEEPQSTNAVEGGES